MRILHVIPSVAPRYGGPSRAVVGMCTALQDAGAEVLIAATDADGSRRLPVELGSITSYRGVPAIFFPRQCSESFKFSWPLARWLSTHAGDFSIVHIHAVFSHACLAAAAASRRSRVPYIVRPLGTLDPWSLAQHPIRKRLLWLVAASRMMRGAAAIHYTSREEQRLAEHGLGLANGVVIALGVDEEVRAGAAASLARSPDRPSTPPYVLAMSRLDPKKGIELLVEAFLQVTGSPSLDEWRLVIAGDGDPAYVQRLKHLTVARDTHARVSFVGWVDGKRRVELLCGASLFALPSYQENFALGVAEAMACGVPVIVGRGVNLSQEIEEAVAGWVTSTDIASLTSVLRRSLEDAEERHRRGREARALVERSFTWTAAGQALLSLYEQLQSSHGTAG